MSVVFASQAVEDSFAFIAQLAPPALIELDRSICPEAHRVAKDMEWRSRG